MAEPVWESFKVAGNQVLHRVKEILHEGNVRQVVVKQGNRTIAVFPVTVGVVGTVAAPVLAAIGTLAALLTECTLEIERTQPKTTARTPTRRKTTKA